VPDIITQKTLAKAFRDHAAGQSYDVADGRVAGLELRVRPRSVRWSMRTALHGKRTRYDLGPAVAGDADVDGLSVDGARSRASRVAEMARNGHNPAVFLAALASGVSMETQIRIETERPKPSWSWETAKKNFLSEVKRANREDTHRDYKGKLQSAELSRFDGRLVNTITRNEMAAAIAEVHARGKEAMAEGMVRVVRRFWNWLAESVRQDQMSVDDGVMLKLEAPPRTRIEIGEKAFDPDEEDGYTPTEIEIGRALAVARLGCLPERIGLGLSLMIGSVQRRRAVTGASRWRFKSYEDVEGEVAWYVPPYFRKSGTKRGKRSHLVPVVGFAATAQERLDKLSDFEGSEGWLFPAGVATRADRGHAESGLFNDWLAAIPGVEFSPHGARYAFATYGERDLGFAQGEGKLILDHLEGVEPTDVTGSFYSSDPQIGRKRAMMKSWTEWCDHWVAKAVADDRALLDGDLMGREVRTKRYIHKKKKPQRDAREHPFPTLAEKGLLS
jgi:integrase